MPSELRVDKISSTTSPYDPVFSTTGGALSHRNMIINGAMQVAQRATSATGVGSGSAYLTLDRYKIDTGNSAGRCTMTQDSSGPSGFANSLKLDCTTADTSIAGNEYFMIQQRLEGQDIQRFAKGTSDAKPFMVSFYVKGNASATYVCELYDTDNTRQVSKSFNVTTAWTRVELAFPADTTGAIVDDNSASIYLIFWLHSGATYAGGTLNSSAWASPTDANRAAGITSFFDSTDRTFFLTGVQLELGTVATPFEHRSYADELARCQRYFYRRTGTISVLGQGAATASLDSGPTIQVEYPVEMRDDATTLTLGTETNTNGSANTTLNSNRFGFQRARIKQGSGEEAIKLNMDGFTVSAEL